MSYTSDELLWKITARDDEIRHLSSQLNERDRKICEMSVEMAKGTAKWAMDTLTMENLVRNLEYGEKSEKSVEIAKLRNVNAILRGDVEELRARPHQESHDLLKAANTALAEENQHLRYSIEQLKASDGSLELEERVKTLEGHNKALLQEVLCWRTEALSLRKENAGLRDLIVDRDATLVLLREDTSEARKLARIAKILEG